MPGRLRGASGLRSVGDWRGYGGHLASSEAMLALLSGSLIGCDPSDRTATTVASTSLPPNTTAVSITPTTPVTDRPRTNQYGGMGGLVAVRT